MRRYDAKQVEKLASMSREERHKLERFARRNPSNPVSREFFMMGAEVKKAVNYKLYTLEKSGYDYGSTYNNLMAMLNIITDSNRAKTLKQLGVDDFITQTEHGIKFLKSPTSNIMEMRRQENARISRLKELDVLPSNFTRSKEKEFLRFLGDEATRGVIDDYGTSDVIVEFAYDVYREEGIRGLNRLRYEFTKYLSTKTTESEQARIKGEDYDKEDITGLRNIFADHGKTFADYAKLRRK